MRRAIVAALLLGLAARGTAGEAPPTGNGGERSARVDDDGHELTVTVDYPDLFDDALGRRLDSGFAMNVVVRGYLLREGRSRPEALAVRTLRAVYDLWEEVYLVEEHDESGTRSFRETTRAAAVRRLTHLESLPLVEASRVPEGVRYAAALVVEVNPVSPALLAQVRRWLTRPPEAHRFTDVGESFFGSFVSIFLNPRVGDAERVLRFRTRPFFRPVRVQPAGKARRPGSER